MNNDFLSSACSSGGCSSCSSCGPTEIEMGEDILKPLGKITAILADIGLEVTYAYDDLVFVQHSAFLLQFTDKPNVLKLFTNSECERFEASSIASKIILAFNAAGFIATPSGPYSIAQNEDQTLQLTFT